MWLLAREAGSDDAKLRGPAIDELLKRLAAGKLAPARVASLCDQFLAWQADDKRTWAPGWGTFIEAVHRSRALSEAKWEHYALNATEPTVRVRSAVRLGDGLPVALTLLRGRVGTTPRSLSVSAEVTGITVDKTFVAAAGSPFISRRVDVSGGAMGGGLVTFAPGSFDAITAGEHDATVHVMLKYYDFTGRAPPRLAQREFNVGVPLEVLGTDANPIHIVRDPALRDRVERAIFADLRDLGASSPMAPQRKQYLSINMRIASPPVGVAYEVFLQTPSGRSRVCEISAPAAGMGFMSLACPLDGLSNFPSDHADFVLVPSARAALHSLDAVEMWDGEVIIRDVSVRSSTATRSASRPVTRPQGTR